MSPAYKQVVIAKWLPLVQEYERVKSRTSPHFQQVQQLLSAYHVTKRDLYKYYERWVASGRKDDALLPHKRGPRVRTRRTPKPIERQIMKAYRNLGAPSYELVMLFKPYYGDRCPSARTIDRIKARYPLNPEQKEKIKRYEKRYPGELGHIDTYYLPLMLGAKRQYLLALEDDCTRLSYTEVLPKLNAQPVSFFIARALCWFKQIYGFHFDAILSDNGSEFRGTPEHPVEAFLAQIGVAHWYTPKYRPQSNGKVEAFFKIVQTELIRAHGFKDIEDFKEQLAQYMFDYNHCRRHGGLLYLTPYEKLEKVTEILT
jgi:transposase InsO family protein